jgi:hypothetical protein
MSTGDMHKTIDRSIQSLNLTAMSEKTANAGSFSGRLDRLIAVYHGVKPLLAALATIPLIPQTWRAAIALFNASLDSVVVAVPDFKAGKDL